MNRFYKALLVDSYQLALKFVHAKQSVSQNKKQRA